jgi:hypothetical protein
MTVELIKQISKARYLHTVAKLTAKENHVAQLLLTAQGGSFRVTCELIAFLSITKLGDTTVILDIYDNPIKVDRKLLLATAIELYSSVMDSWATAVDEINKQR